MTREEEYYKYCSKIQYESYNYEGQPNIVDAIKWADEHPKSPWIKCSERLPETYKKVLLIYFYDWYGDVKIGGPTFGWYDGEDWDFYTNKRESDIVVAWMEIPKYTEFFIKLKKRNIIN